MPDEPLFRAIARNNPDFQQAYTRAAATLPHFVAHLRSGIAAFHSVKLRFRDPDESKRLGEDQFIFLWLTAVHYHPDERLFSGTFFEVPNELQKWHRVGEQLAFDPEDIFDWMVLRDGHLQGGFTLRATRAHLPEAERSSHDRHIGVTAYDRLPGEAPDGTGR